MSEQASKSDYTKDSWYRYETLRDMPEGDAQRRGGNQMVFSPDFLGDFRKYDGFYTLGYNTSPVGETGHDQYLANQWKFHISVHEEDVPKAWNAVAEYAVNNGISKLKVATPETAATFANPDYMQSGKMITIYAGDKDLSQHIPTIERILEESGVREGAKVKADRPIAGSKYASYRNDGGAHYYLATEELLGLPAERQYNPHEAPDPYRDLSVEKTNAISKFATHSTQKANVTEPASQWQIVFKDGPQARLDIDAMIPDEISALKSGLSRKGIGFEDIHSSSGGRALQLNNFADLKIISPSHADQVSIFGRSMAVKEAQASKEEPFVHGSARGFASATNNAFATTLRVGEGINVATNIINGDYVGAAESAGMSALGAAAQYAQDGTTPKTIEMIMNSGATKQAADGAKKVLSSDTAKKVIEKTLELAPEAAPKLLGGAGKFAFKSLPVIASGVAIYSGVDEMKSVMQDKNASWGKVATTAAAITEETIGGIFGGVVSQGWRQIVVELSGQLGEQYRPRDAEVSELAKMVVNPVADKLASLYYGDSTPAPSEAELQAAKEKHAAAKAERGKLSNGMKEAMAKAGDIRPSTPMQYTGAVADGSSVAASSAAVVPRSSSPVRG